MLQKWWSLPVSAVQGSVFIENSHAFNYNKFSSQRKLYHLEDINIIYNLFTSLFHREFLLLANFPLFSRKKEKSFHRLPQVGFIYWLKPSRKDSGAFWTLLLLIYFNSWILFPIKNILFYLLLYAQPSNMAFLWR